MKKIGKYELVKCSDINLELPFYEIWDEEDTILIGIYKSDNGDFRILFHDGCASKSIPLEILEKLINEAKDLINQDEE